jgi:hypothetical protein
LSINHIRILLVLCNFWDAVYDSCTRNYSCPSSSTLNIKGKKRVLIHIEGKTTAQLESNFQFESEVGSTKSTNNIKYHTYHHNFSYSATTTYLYGEDLF